MKKKTKTKSARPVIKEDKTIVMRLVFGRGKNKTEHNIKNKWLSSFGQPTEKNIEKFTKKYLEQFMLGGVYESVGIMFRGLPVLTCAYIYDDKTEDVLCFYTNTER